jgi:hypothetical protein
MSLNSEAHGKALLGTNAACLFVSAIETGIVIVFFSRFFARKEERTAIQLLVYFVTFVALYVGRFGFYMHCESLYVDDNLSL